MQNKFFEIFFEPVYRFYYYTYGSDIISGHEDRTKHHIDIDIKDCKIELDVMQKIFQEEEYANVLIRGNTYYCYKVDVHQPIFKITPQIILSLEYIALNNDFILTKIPHPNEVFADDLYVWRDSTNLNRHYCNTAEKLRVNAVLSLLINIKEDIYNDVREIFSAK